MNDPEYSSSLASAEDNESAANSIYTRTIACTAGALLVAGTFFGVAKTVEGLTHFEPSVSQIHDQIVNGYPQN